MTTMTAAELRAIRAGLGVTAEWLAGHLGVQTRTVQRWEAGATPIRAFAVEALQLLEAEAADQVRRHVEAFEAASDRVPPVLFVEDSGQADWPPGWQRMIAFRVRQAVPGLRIIDTD